MIIKGKIFKWRKGKLFTDYMEIKNDSDVVLSRKPNPDKWKVLYIKLAIGLLKTKITTGIWQNHSSSRHIMNDKIIHNKCLIPLWWCVISWSEMMTLNHIPFLLHQFESPLKNCSSSRNTIMNRKVVRQENVLPFWLGMMSWNVMMKVECRPFILHQFASKYSNWKKIIQNILLESFAPR